MNLRTYLTTGFVSLLIGCTFHGNPVYYPPEETTTVETYETHYYVDTYLPLPSSVTDLIAPYVYGYFSPSNTRYSDFLYYQDYPRSWDNRPCYVIGDLDGNFTDDHVLLFSKEDRYSDSWELTTKLLVVLSTPGYTEIAVDMELGTISADNAYPIEEYWSLCKMPRGSHTYRAFENGIEVIETVVLEEDAFLLTFLETGEQDLFYASGNDLYYMPWAPASLAKRRNSSKQMGNRKIISNWREKIEKRVK